MKKQPKTESKEGFYATKSIIEAINTSDYKRKDDLFAIIDMIYRKQSLIKANRMNYCYVNIATKEFNKFISDNNFIKNGLAYLVELNVIEMNEKYSTTSNFSKSYKITEGHISSNKERIEVTDKTMIKKIKAYRDSLRAAKVQNLELQKSKYYKTFKIDYFNARQAISVWTKEQIENTLKSNQFYLSEKEIFDLVTDRGESKKVYAKVKMFGISDSILRILNRAALHQRLLDSINDGFLFFKRNDTNNRLDSNLTNLPSYLRKHIITEEPLKYVDIKNCQPFLLLTELNEGVDTNELERYRGLVISGGIYEFFLNLRGFKKENYSDDAWNVLRGKEKKNVFYQLYSKPGSFSKQKELFRQEFPSISKRIDELKSEDYTYLAIKLQKLESSIVLDKIMPALNYRYNIQPLTIHDSLIHKETETEMVISVVREMFLQEVGYAPQLHEEDLINKIEDTEDEYEEDLLPEGW